MFKTGALLRHFVEKIEFTPSFVCDFAVNIAFVIVTSYLYSVSAAAPSAAGIVFVAAVVFGAQAAKVVIMFSLDWRGGDAGLRRSYVLVTDGIYRYTRNPAYLITILQNVTWSLFLLFAMAGGPASIALIAISLMLPLVHFIILDRFIIQREEVDLLHWHPKSYPAYASRVNRWFGRRGQLAASASTSSER
jgi:protein-S-isoprenylcysteine O-methyltransferase Ste14